MRLIDADTLGKTDRPVGKLMMFGGEYVYTQTEIDNATTIDAVPVVRCPSCKFHEDVAGYHECKKLRMRCPNDAEFFCKYGQRREDGDA